MLSVPRFLNSLPATRIRRSLVLFIAGLASTATQADTATVAVASNFANVMAELETQFEAKSGHTLNVAYGSSGKFFAQIRHGAPFDVFLSADATKPQALAKAGSALPATQFTYALGTLVVWSANPDLKLTEGAALKRQQFKKLALANPRLAPYGLASQQTLAALGLEKSTRARWVQGENITQAFQFIATGNADLGFVALSQLLAQQGRGPQFGSDYYWRVPHSLYEPIRQDAILLKRGEKNPAAQALLVYLQSDAATSIIKAGGYDLDPAAGPAADPGASDTRTDSL